MQCLDICKTINFPVIIDKTTWGTQILVFLGIILNAILQTITIPEEKRIKAVKQIQALLSKKKVTVLQLQRLTGFLNFLCRAFVPGRAFTRRLYAKFSDPKLKQHYHVNMDSEIKLDLQVWLEFLDDSVPRPFLDFTKKSSVVELKFFTDASGAVDKGFGHVCWWQMGIWYVGTRLHPNS